MGNLFLQYANVTIDELFEFYSSIKKKCANPIDLMNYSKYNDDDRTQTLNEYYFGLILVLEFIPLFKTLVIFLYFFIYISISKLLKFLINLISIKCSLKSIKCWDSEHFNISNYFRKIYTYNFYTFENKFVGTILISAYLFFMIINVTFVYFFLRNIKEDCPKKDYFMKYLHIFAFLSHSFIEIFCSFYYSLKKSVGKILLYSSLYFFICTSTSISFHKIVFGKDLIIMQIYGDQYNDKTNLNLSKFLHFIYCGGTCILFVFAFNGIYQYRESKELLIEYMESKRKCESLINIDYINNQLPYQIFSYEEEKIGSLNNLKLKHSYRNINDKYFFKRSKD